MKKQNQMNKLAFNKANVTELNNNEMIVVNGGSVDKVVEYVFKAGEAIGKWLAGKCQ